MNDLTSRTFLAAPAPKSAIADIRQLMQQLQKRLDLPRVRWTPSENLHITVKFLGEVDNCELPEFCRLVRNASQDLSAMQLTIDQLGTFPTGKSPRVLWAGLADSPGKTALTELHERIDKDFAGQGIPQETRGYTPHLTLAQLARGLQPEQISEALAEVSSELQINFPVHRLQLLSSIRERDGVIYHSIDTIDL